MREFFNTFKDIFDKKYNLFFLVQSLLIISSLLEIIPVYILSITIYLLSFSHSSEETNFLDFDISYFTNFLVEDSNTRIFLIMVFLLLSLITFFNWITIRIYSKFAEMVGNDVATRCFNQEINSAYDNEYQLNLSEINTKIFSDCEGVTRSIHAFFQFVSRAVLAILLSLSLILISPIITILMITAVASIYWLILVFTSKQFSENSKIIASANKARIRVVKNSFNSFREIFLYKKERVFLENFNNIGITKAGAASKNALYTFGPRYFVELILFLLIISSIIILIEFQGDSSQELIASISLFGLSGIKLLPAFQGAYFGLSTVQSNTQHILNVKNSLKNKKRVPHSKSGSNRLIDLGDIVLQDIEYKRQGFKFGPINLKISRGTLTGLAGRSGSGKSTFFDLILGFIEPNSGRITINNIDINKIKDEMHNSVGFVPQNIAIIDGSLIENLTLSIESDNPSKSLLEESLYLSGLEDFMIKKNITLESELSFDLLSGGEIQKIAFCRSLLRNPEIFILDEFTSSVDEESKEKIFATLKNLSNAGKTIIFSSHQFLDFKQCTNIAFLKEGSLSGYDTFNNLYNNNDEFKRIVKIQKEKTITGV